MEVKSDEGDLSTGPTMAAPQPEPEPGVLLLTGRSCAKTDFEVAGSFQVAGGHHVVIEQKSNQVDNTGFIVWDAAVEAVRYLEANEERIKEAFSSSSSSSSSIGAANSNSNGSVYEIIELGSGCGLLGISAAKIFRKGTVLTDLHEVIPNLEHNIRLNVDASANEAPVKSEALDWSEKKRLEAFADQYGKSLKLVLASDCIWRRDQVEDFADVLFQLAERGEDVRVILSQQRRSDPLEKYLEENLHRRGFIVRDSAVVSSKQKDITIRELVLRPSSSTWFELVVRESGETQKTIVRLLERSGASCQGDGRVRCLRNRAWEACRLSCLTEDELYFLGEDQKDGKKVISLRNEYATAAKICDLQRGAKHALLEPREIDQRLDTLPLSTQQGVSKVFGSDSDEARVVEWAKGKGIESKICPATISYGDGQSRRGAVSSGELMPGDCVLSIRQDCLLGIWTALKSDIGDLISQILSQAGEDFALILWTLWDRRREDSEFAAVWRCLPDAFGTGLSAKEGDLKVVEGLPLGLEISSAQEHLRSSYESYFKPLMKALEGYLGVEGFGWTDFLWASELWYAYAVQVQSDTLESNSSCLAPLLFFCNHSLNPHMVHFSRIRDGVLQVPCCRRAGEGEEIFLSYGPLPCNRLITFYGFAIPSNPYDFFEIQFEPEDLALSEEAATVLRLYGIGMEHKLSREKVSDQLLACLKIVMASGDELQKAAEMHSFDAQMGWALDLGEENEGKACETLEALVTQLIDSLAAGASAGIEEKGKSMFEIYADSMRTILQCTLTQVQQRKAMPH